MKTRWYWIAIVAWLVNSLAAIGTAIEGSYHNFILNAIGFFFCVTITRNVCKLYWTQAQIATLDEQEKERK